jgi:NitT/TauT family transport system substrate-binding protein
MSFARRSRVAALAAALVAVFALGSRPAGADDELSVIGGANASAFFEVLNNVAGQAGFYKELHLTVNTQYAGGPNIAAQLCATGKADICGQSIEPLFLGYQKGLRLQGFFVRDPENDYVVGVLDDSPIRTLADFKGTTIGEYSVGSPAELSANAMFAGAGLKKTDVSYIPIGAGAQAIQALTTKKVAAAAFPYPELAAYEVAAHIKFRFFFDPLIRDIGNTVYASTPTTIAAKNDALKRFARAQVMAAILIRENPTLAARYFLEGAQIKVTPQALADEIRLLALCADQLPGADPLSKRIGAMPLVGMNLYSRFLYDQGFTTQPVPASAVVTNDLIDYANDFDHKAFIARVKAMH